MKKTHRALNPYCIIQKIHESNGNGIKIIYVLKLLLFTQKNCVKYCNCLYLVFLISNLIGIIKVAFIKKSYVIM